MSKKNQLSLFEDQFDGLGKVDRDKLKKSIVDLVTHNLFDWKKPWKPVKDNSYFFKINGKIAGGVINAYNFRAYENPKNVFALVAYTADFNTLYGTNFSPIFVPYSLVRKKKWQITPREYMIDSEGDTNDYCKVNQTFWVKILDEERIQSLNERLKEGKDLPWGVRKTKDGDFIEIQFTYESVVLAENIVGNPLKIERVEINEAEMIDYIDKIIEAYSGNVAKVYNDQSDRCYYSPRLDEIHIVPAKGFDNVNEYYSTRFHETVHSTLAKKRLDRNFGSKEWGDAGYAEEELVAEIGSYMLCSELGVNYYRKDKTTPFSTKDNSMAYLASWVKKAKELYDGDEEKAIVDAFNHASKAVDFILNGVDFESMIPDSVKSLEDEESADVLIFENDDVKVVDVRSDNRIRMFFKKIPSEDLRKEMLEQKFYYANSFKAWQIVDDEQGKSKVQSFLSKHYGYKAPVNVPKPSDNPVKDDSKLRLAKARAKAIIIRQRQRTRERISNLTDQQMFDDIFEVYKSKLPQNSIERNRKNTENAINCINDILKGNKNKDYSLWLYRSPVTRDIVFQKIGLKAPKTRKAIKEAIDNYNNRLGMINYDMD